MSSKSEKTLALSGLDYSNYNAEEIQDLFAQMLSNGMHGICFSAYLEGQKPGDILSEAQVRQRMEILQPYTKWIRSFSVIEGNEWIPKIAKELGIKTMVGAWLGDEKDKNEEEIEKLIALGQQGFVDIAAVGNEVLLRGDLTEEELVGYIERVKTALPDIPVGYVDAYFEFRDHPNISAACDVILANCYPFWEGCHLDYSLVYMKQMYQQAVQAGGGKKVIVSETGWPSQGTNCKAAEPGRINAMKYFINSQQWSAADDIEMFYFTSFDESWKVGAEGDVGAYWGLWDHEGKLKF